MKHKNLIPILAALLLSACDPGYSFDFAVNNQTGHTLTIQSLDTARHYLTLTVPAQTDTAVFEWGGMGYASIPEVSYDLRANIYGDSMQVIFDDGRTLRYSIFTDTGSHGGPYCFNDTNHLGSRYIYLPRLNKHTFKGNAGYCRYTLNITDDDYNLSE